MPGDNFESAGIKQLWQLDYGTSIYTAFQIDHSFPVDIRLRLTS
jgi:hypothetical protein